MSERYRFLFLLLIVITAAFTFINSVFFLISDVTILGNKSITSEELLKVAGIGERENYFKLDVNTVETNLKLCPIIKEASVQKIFPSSLKIEVMERVPVAILPKEGYFIEIDKDGVAMAITDRILEKSMPIITGMDTDTITLGSRLNTQGLDGVMDILSTLRYDIIEDLSEINVSDSSDIRLYTLDGLRIYMGQAINLNKKAQVLQSILLDIKEKGSAVEYIDIRYENAPVIK